MLFDNNTISVNYSDKQLRILVEEYITMQKHDFTFKGICSYVLYCAMEENRTANTRLYESNQLSSADCRRLTVILRKVTQEGRITCTSEQYSDDTLFVK